MKKIAAWALAFCLLLALTACSQNESHVFVQKVSDLSAMGGIAPTDRFSGIVVSESVTEIKKDSDKEVAELLVKEGQDVQEGDPLFSYDTDQLQLNADKLDLEREQLSASISTVKNVPQTNTASTA